MIVNVLAHHMKTTIQEPREILEYLRPYYKAQKIIILIELFGGKIVTGELLEIGTKVIQVVSQDDETGLEVEIALISSITHGPVYEGKLKGVAA